LHWSLMIVEGDFKRTLTNIPKDLFDAAIKALASHVSSLSYLSGLDTPPFHLGFEYDHDWFVLALESKGQPNS